MGSNDVRKITMTQDKTPKAIFNVLLSNGERMAHVYDVSSNYDKALEFTETMIGAITGALTRGKPWFLFLQEPSIVYNPDHVMAVMLDFVNAEDLEKAFRKVRRGPMGFVRQQG